MTEYNMGPYRIRPCNEFDPTKSYRYLDLVTYDGGSYLCCNMDTIDGIAVTGVLPTGQPQSKLYWQCIGSRGEKGETGNGYKEFISITNGVWDFSKSDKIIIPDNGSDTLLISNVSNGCCGVILTSKELTLPTNSEYSIDFNYVTCGTNQYYMYTFIYGAYDGSNNKFIWNRTVINQ